MAAQGRTATVAELPSRGTKRTSRNGPVRRVLPLGLQPSRKPPADLDVAILGQLAPMHFGSTMLSSGLAGGNTPLRTTWG
jgi:hypothetical protein